MRHDARVRPSSRPRLLLSCAFAWAACSSASGPASIDHKKLPAATQVTQGLQDHPPAQAAKPPRLIVVLVVDQMRAEMLERYGPYYSAGMRRLLDDGVRYTRARHAHASTYTAPGHATLSTGMHPREHGIVANSWIDERGIRQYAASDLKVEPLGAKDGFRGAPSWLEREALGDWLHAAHPEAKVWALALKNRAAIMMGGKHPDGVLWWNDEPASYVSSHYYFETLPPWLAEFAAAWPLAKKIDTIWEKPETLHASRVEDAPSYEGPFAAFPHDIKHFWDKVGAMARYTPMGEAMNFALARELIEREGLGADAQPDILWLGASASDWIGHRFGPRSHEMETYQLAFDQLLGELLTFLDKRFPEGDYLLALTSDHGASEIPESLKDADPPGGRIEGEAAVRRRLAQIVRAKQCPRGAFEVDVHQGVSLRPVGNTKTDEATKAKCLDALARALEQEEWAQEILKPAQLAEPVSTQDSPYASAAKLSYYAGRSAELFVRLPRHHIFARGYHTGTSHGSAYSYDQDVPLVFFSPQLEAAQREALVSTVDLAPTLAPLLGAPLPPDLAGKAIPTMADDFARLGWPSGPGPE